MTENGDLIKIALSAAVPLWIMQFKQFTAEERTIMAGRYGQVVAEHGDNILFKSKKKGATADAFNNLAKGVACLAFAPGGVTVMGLHFEATAT